MAPPWVRPSDDPADGDGIKYNMVPLNDEMALEVEMTASEGDAELVQLRKEVENLLEEEEHCQKQLNSLNSFCNLKASILEQELQVFMEKRTQSEERIESIEQMFVVQEGPSGLKKHPSLSWVQGSRFNALSSLVVIANLVTMVMEMLDKNNEARFWMLDQVVLIFYISEMTLKAIVYERELLVGPCGVVWWNYLDMTIVIAAIIDQWLRPLMLPGGDAANGKAQSSSAVQIIKMLRIARLARILKTVRAFMQSDLSWTESKHFQLFIMGTIAFNSIIMSFESDFPDFWAWWYVEQILLLIFSFELLVRLKFSGCRFFYHPTDIVWNWLDFTIVSGGICDAWLMPAMKLGQALMGMKHTDTLDIGELMMTLRTARLLRILRLVRLVKSIPPLFTLIVGIMQAMQGMAWVLVLTAVFLYAFALLSVRLIGHGLIFGGKAPDDVAQIFPSVPQSMFVLFKVMNGDTNQIEPLFRRVPLSKLFCVLYMVVSSWAILSILTAVVSDNMINATDTHRQDAVQQNQQNIENQTRAWLKDIFCRADEKGNGQISERKFKELIADEGTLKQLMDLTDLTEKDITDVFYLLKTTETCTVCSDVFVEALRTENQNVTERSVLRLEKRLKNLQLAVEHVNTSQPPAGKSAAEPARPASRPGGALTADARSIELMLEHFLIKMDERLERNRRQTIELLASPEAKLDAGKAVPSNGSISTQASTSIESSLLRIEEQLDLSSQFLDRSRVECTIVSSLAKVEQQTIDIMKALRACSGTESLLQPCNRYSSYGDGLHADREHSTVSASTEVDPTVKSSLARIEERLDKLGGRDHGLREIGTELSSLESVMQKLDHHLSSIRTDQSLTDKQQPALPLQNGRRSAEGSVRTITAASVSAASSLAAKSGRDTKAVVVD